MRYFIPSKSGIHRSACRSLYRALLRATAYQNETQQPHIQALIQGRFRRDARLQSPKDIKAALEDGHTGLTLLTKPENLSPREIADYKETLQLRKLPVIPPRPAPPGPRVWAFPGAKPVLEARPIPTSALAPGKKRNVPTLVNTGGIPFLRFKKPQSPFLSRILRDKKKQRQKWLDLINRLQEERALAKDEELWDKIIDRQAEQESGGSEGLGGSAEALNAPEGQENEQSWEAELVSEISATTNKYIRDKDIQARKSKQMWEIYQSERALKVIEEGEEAVRQVELSRGRGLAPGNYRVKLRQQRGGDSK